MFGLPWFPRSPLHQHTLRAPSSARMDAVTAYAATSFTRFCDRLGHRASHRDQRSGAVNGAAVEAPGERYVQPASEHRDTSDNETLADDTGGASDAGSAHGTLIAVGVHQRIVLPLPARAHLLVCDGSVDVEYRPAALDWIPERLQDPGPVALSDGEHYECAEPGCVVVYGTGQHVAHVLIAQEPGPCRTALQWVQRVFRHRRGQYPSRNTSGSGQRPRA